MTAKAPIEGKVWSSTVGAGVGATVSALTLWLFGVTIWGVPNTAAHAADAISAVPAPVNGALVLLITVGLTFLAGYSTKHTPRPADAAALVSENVAAPPPRLPNTMSANLDGA